MSASVQEIIVQRLLDKIKSDKRLPWQKPFVCGSINWSTEKEYVGINKILLEGGEYIAPGQLKTYNEKHKTTYWFQAGDPYELAVYYGPKQKVLTDAEREEIETKGVPKKWKNKLKKKGNDLVLCSWVLCYHRVYNIKYIKDKEGNQLPSKMGTLFVETYTKPDEIISTYCEGTGVKIVEDPRDGACYVEMFDTVYTPPHSYYKSNEEYYRTIFHELGHSTGIESRLNRECFKKYDYKESIRGREELIVEVASLLLASEAGFKEDTPEVENADNYILSWLKWMQDNPNEVVLGMQQAEKVKNYILNGGELPTYADDTVTETDIE